MLLRLAAGLAVAGLVAWLARRAGSLSHSGAWAATLVGAMAAAAGWPWAVLLIGWFVASSALTRVGAATKAARTRATLDTAHARTATQVWANGAVFSSAALLAALTGESGWELVALGALGAASADTWSTEIGTLWGGTPRSVLSGEALAAGLSGGITPVGSLGGVAGAMAVALAATALLPGVSWGRLAIAGVLGGLADSVLGASVQATRRCPRCGSFTERRTHDCGTATAHARGWRWMTNDTVNLAATLTGAASAYLLSIP